MSPLDGLLLAAWTLLGAWKLAELLFPLFVWIGKQRPRRHRWPKAETKRSTGRVIRITHLPRTLEIDPSPPSSAPTPGPAERP